MTFSVTLVSNRGALPRVYRENITMHRLFSLLIALVIMVGCKDDPAPKFNPDPNTVYFLIGERAVVRGESFIIGLTDPHHIETARATLQSGEEKIVFAEISKITNPRSQANLDLANGGKWSWYVSKVLEFTDVTAEIYDGWPSYVEENYNEFVENTKGNNGTGRIGFWNYTLKREVSHEELN
jgi:hypothetical protein